MGWQDLREELGGLVGLLELSVNSLTNGISKAGSVAAMSWMVLDRT